MIWAHGYDGGTSSGLSFGIGADSFIVTLGKWADHGSSDAKVGTFIHELGHNLGLGHGGNDLITNYKPDYLSVMNYFFQVSGVPQSGGRPPLFSYSRVQACRPRRARSPSRRAPRRCAPRASRPVGSAPTTRSARPRTPRRRADRLELRRRDRLTSVASDINHDDQQTTFDGWRDWGNLYFTGGTIGADGPGHRRGVLAPLTPMPRELTYEESLRLAR